MHDWLTFEWWLAIVAKRVFRVFGSVQPIDYEDAAHKCGSLGLSLPCVYSRADYNALQSM